MNTEQKLLLAIENNILKSFVIDESKMNTTLEYDENGKLTIVPIEKGNGCKVKYTKTDDGWVKEIL